MSEQASKQWFMWLAVYAQLLPNARSFCCGAFSLCTIPCIRTQACEAECGPAFSMCTCTTLAARISPLNRCRLMWPALPSRKRCDGRQAMMAAPLLHGLHMEYFWPAGQASPRRHYDAARCARQSAASVSARVGSSGRCSPKDARRKRLHASFPRWHAHWLLL